MKTWIVVGCTLAQKDDYIINGMEAVPFQYPYLITILKGGKIFCAGTLLNKNTMTTAAHCSLLDKSQYEVHHHRHDLSLSPQAEGGKVLKVKAIHLHPGYTPNKTINDSN